MRTCQIDLSSIFIDKSTKLTSIEKRAFPYEHSYEWLGCLNLAISYRFNKLSYCIKMPILKAF